MARRARRRGPARRHPRRRRAHAPRAAAPQPRVSPSGTGDRAGDERPRALPHRRQERLRPGAVDERRRVVDGRPARPAASDAASGAPVSGSQAITRVCGETAASALAIPVVSPPPPHGTSTASISSSCSASSSPIDAVAGHDALVEHGMDEEPVEARVAARPPSSPTSVSNGTRIDACRRAARLRRASPAARGRARRRSRARRARARPSTRPGPCSRRSSSRRPPSTSAGSAWRIAFAAPRILNEPIGCRHSSLSQISHGASTSSRTSGVAETVVGGRLAGPLDRRRAGSEVDLGADRLARVPASTQSTAAARSSTASPSDLNTVSSSSGRRPGCVPASSSPSSARMWSGPMPRSSTARR